MTTITASATTTDPSNRAEALRKAGWFGLAGSAAYLTTGVLANIGASIDPAESAGDTGRYLADIEAVAAGHIAYGLAGIALCLLYVPMAKATTGLLGGSQRARQGTFAIIAGLLALIPAYVASIVSSGGVVTIARHTAVTDSQLFGLLEALDVVSTASFAVGSFLSLGVGPLLWGLAAAGATPFPRWVRNLFLSLGATGVVWILPMSTVLIVPLMINVLASLTAYTALSVVLVRRARS